jgi:acetyltransferase-like isoleucine patch superfamily enzyme
MIKLPLKYALHALGPLNRINQALYMSCVLRVLSTAGVGITGRPLWIGSSVRFDIEGTGGITLGDRCVVSEDVKILTHDYSMDRVAELREWIAPHQELYRSATVRIDNHSFVGMGAILMPGVHVGAGAVVAAGSVVTRDVAPMTVVAGNPATLLCTVDEWVQRSRHKFNSKNRRG